MKNKMKVIAAALAVAAIAMLAYSLLTGVPTDEDTTDHPGMWDPDRAYSDYGLVVIVAASFLIAVAVMFILLREEYVPLPPSMTPPPPPPPERAPAAEPVPVPDAAPPEGPEEKAARPTEEVEAEENYLVLRLLSGDERAMFKAIMDSKGEALQKDLMQRTNMSNAKVSRVLEKLEQKGVVSKERYGSTNKIRIRLRT
ncbi:MAG: helix-turn-helix domain-containing protein [Candidatus Thermoplasmatota archaeon]